MTDDRLGLDALQERLQGALALRGGRGAVAIVEAPETAQESVIEVARRAMSGADRDPSLLLVVQVEDHESSKRRLARLNRDRDLLLRDQSVVLLLVPDARAHRVLRSTAPDLTAAPDYWGQLEEARTHRSWAQVREEIRALMRQRHASLDLTGLLPASVEKRTVPLAELYMDLVDLEGKAPEPQAPRGWLLLADPGTGKTTALRHLALTYATGEDDPARIGAGAVPILIPVADFAETRAEDRALSLVEFLRRWLSEAGIDAGDALEAGLGEVFLLLDGLDEAREPTTRRAVLEEARELLPRLRGVVISGRSFLVDELRAADVQRFSIVTCRQPTERERRDYLHAFVKLRGVEEADRVASTLAAQINADPDLGSLARTPLLLLFLALLHELEGRLPDRRVEIYGRLSELLVERWIRSRSLAKAARSDHGRAATRGEALRVLGPLAWWLVEQGGGSVPEEALEQRLLELEARRASESEAHERAHALLSLLKQDSALLRPEGRRRWAFIHQSVTEFFAARELDRDAARWEAVLEDPLRPEWREIVLFAAGLFGHELGKPDRVDELVRAVMRQTRRAGRYEARHPGLLAALLLEDPDLTSAQKERLAARLCEFWFTTKFYPASAHRVQYEALVVLTEGVVNPALRRALQPALAQWCEGTNVQRIRLDRMLIRRRMGEILSPLLDELPKLLPRYGVDPTSLREKLQRWPGPAEPR